MVIRDLRTRLDGAFFGDTVTNGVSQGAVRPASSPSMSFTAFLS
jgi:hypothetical protein